MGLYTHSPRYSNDDKNLISEQPGRFILFGGIFLAVALGLILRGLLSPNKIRPMIESAASRIHKNIHVEFEGAQISLAQGLLPRFAVIVTKVQMESENECWMSPQLTVDELRLPLSIWSLLQGKSPITRVEAGLVRVDLRRAYKNCENEGAQKNDGAPKITQFVTLKKGPGSNSQARATPQVNTILVDQLKISAPFLKEPLELNSFGLRLKSNSPRVLEVHAKTHLMKDGPGGDYLSHSIVWGEYSEFPKSTLQARLSGNWREGSYNLKANYFMKEEELSTELDLKHIPLSQVFQLLKKFRWLKEDLNGKQVWVSLNAQASITKSNFKSAELQIKDVRMEGDVGDLKVEHVHVVSLDPVTYMPFFVDIQRMNIEKLLSVLNQPHPSPIFGKLGSFTGVAEVSDQNQISIEGLHRGVEFVFSNKGQREVQALDEIATRMKLEKDRWQIQVSQFQPNQGVFDGQVLLNADKDFKSLEVKAKMNEVRLSPAVVRLMTTGGQVGPLSGEMNFKFERGHMNYVKGLLMAESLDVEGVALSKARFNVDYGSGEVQTYTQIQKLSVVGGSSSFKIIKDLTDPEWMNDNQLKLKNLNAYFHAKSFKELRWKGLSAQLEQGGRITSEGDWDPEGFLSGMIQAQTVKGSQKWLISGKRDEPIFTGVDLARKKKQ